VTSRVASGSASRVTRVTRARRWLIFTFVMLVASNFAVWSLVGHDLHTQVRYTGSAQEEIDARREAVRDAPDNPGALLALAYAYQQTGRYDDALFTYDAVLDLLPSETAALYNKGVILLKLGETAAAEEVLRAALDVNPGHALAAATLARQLVDDGDYEAVLEVVLPAAERSPGAAELHYLAGVAHEKLGEAEMAAERYRLALHHYPDMGEAREGLRRLGVTP
jgi:tetratricopeptide (TPR) repeat protein